MLALHQPGALPLCNEDAFRVQNTAEQECYGLQTRYPRMEFMPAQPLARSTSHQQASNTDAQWHSLRRSRMAAGEQKEIAGSSRQGFETLRALPLRGRQ